MELTVNRPPRNNIGKLPDRKVKQTWKNHPKMVDKFKVPDPRAIFQGANNQSYQIQNALFAARWEIKYGFWPDSIDDALQIHSVPVFMLLDAIKSLKKVKEVGENVDRNEKKKKILEIISAVLMIVPFVGPIGLEAAGFTKLATSIAWLGVAGQEAISIYDAVSVSRRCSVKSAG